MRSRVRACARARARPPLCPPCSLTSLASPSPPPPPPPPPSSTSQDVATFAASCEKYVGTESGGMDQAISIMGQPGTAKLVSFNPVAVADVALPPDAVFVVANSLAVSKKAETADVHYNLRVVECRVAAAALGRVLLGGEAAEAGTVRGLTTLRAVEPLIGASSHGPGVAGKLAAVGSILRGGAYSQAECEAAIGMPLADLLADAPAQARAAAAAFARPDVGGLRLRDRAAHVYAEAARVHAFRAAAAGEGGGDALAGLGRLMDESQASCRYEGGEAGGGGGGGREGERGGAGRERGGGGGEREWRMGGMGAAPLGAARDCPPPRPPPCSLARTRSHPRAPLPLPPLSSPPC